MRVVVVGGTGHIGTWLVPRLVAAGHEVVSLTRGRRAPYPRPGVPPVTRPEAVRTVVVDRDAEDATGTFGRRVRELEADAVVDLVCFTPDSARQLTDALRGTGCYLVHIRSSPRRSIAPGWRARR